jgi:hypothetical protein
VPGRRPRPCPTRSRQPQRRPGLFSSSATGAPCASPRPRDLRTLYVRPRRRTRPLDAHPQTSPTKLPPTGRRREHRKDERRVARRPSPQARSSETTRQERSPPARSTWRVYPPLHAGGLLHGRPVALRHRVELLSYRATAAPHEERGLPQGEDGDRSHGSRELHHGRRDAERARILLPVRRAVGP